MDEDGQLVRVFIPDINAQKCLVVNPNDTVWAAKQVVLDKINQELPNNPLNYSLYLPSTGAGKLGKFMDDGRVLMEYALSGTVPRLEIRYKKRDYTIQVSLTDKAIVKANSKANQKKFVEHVMTGSTKKVEKLLEAGIDPNYITEDGNTPLGIACGRGGKVNCIMQILSNGGHIDFRGRDALTPMHRAAIGGNPQAVNVLLSFGAGLEYKDSKGLTPLYHTAIMGDGTGAAFALLRNRAQVGIKDHGGWTELHQTSKYGHIEHAELFIRYGVDINTQNLVGNTPLHVACSHAQVDCAMLLLKRGADKSKLNFSNQTPSQVAILCGHHQLAADITAFSSDNIELVKFPGDYNPSARVLPTKMFDVKPASETCPLSPPAELLVSSLTQEWEGGEVGGLGEPPKLFQLKGSGRPGSASSKSSAGRVPDSESICSLEQDSSTHSGSTAGTPGQTTPVYPRRQPQRERLYRAVQGQEYVAVQDVDAQQPGDIPLHRGEPVEVTFIGKGGYWEGRAGEREGWFPRLAINEVGSEYYTDDTQTPKSVTPKLEERKMSNTHTSSSSNSNSMEEQSRASSIRDVVITRSSRGFGFAMRGVRATKEMEFHPTPGVPALQYVGSVETGGSADEAGLRTGDFIIEVNSHNVTYSTHDEVVDIVKKSGGVLRMRIITPLVRPKSHSEQIRSQITPIATPEQLSRQASIPEDGHNTPTPHSHYASQDPETLIGNESPAVARITRSGWDSSQSQGEESPSSAFASTGFSYYHVPASSTVAAPPSPISYVQHNYSPAAQVKAYPIPSSHNAAGKLNLSYSSSPQSLAQQYPAVAGVSQTLPVLPKPDYPKLSDYKHDSDMSSEEEEADSSDFARELRKSKEKMAGRQSQIGTSRQRALTNPDNTRNGNPLSRNTSKSPPLSPTEEDSTMSPLAAQILKANRDRKERMSLNQPRMTGDSTSQQATVGSNNPLAKAMSEQIDKMQPPEEVVDSRTSWDDSPHGSPHRIRLQSLPRKMPDVAYHPSPRWSKDPPPTVKPKPSKKTAAFVVPDSPLSAIKAEPPTIKEETEEEEERVVTPPWKVQLRSTPVSERKSPNHKPPEDDSLSLKVKPKPSPAVAKKPTRPSTKQASQQAVSTTQEAVDLQEYSLPPPLPPSLEHGNALSSDELLPPPPAAFIIAGVEEGESSTDDFIPPPPPTSSDSLTDPHSPSPAPPPPPQTSPPSQLPTLLSVPSEGEVFIFPETTGDSDVPNFEPTTTNTDSNLTSPTLPSPIASPLVKRTTNFPASPLPPPDFATASPGENVCSPCSPSSKELEQTSPASDTSDAPPPLPSEPPPPLELEEGEEEEGGSAPEPVEETEDDPTIKEDMEPRPPPRPPLPVMEDSEIVERKVSTASSSVALDDRAPSEQVAGTAVNTKSPDHEVDSGYSERPVEQWGVEEVCAWLTAIGLGEHCGQFTENEIVGDHLADMSKEDLRELGVKKLGHQKTFAAKIAAVLLSKK